MDLRAPELQHKNTQGTAAWPGEDECDTGRPRVEAAQTSRICITMRSPHRAWEEAAHTPSNTRRTVRPSHPLGSTTPAGAARCNQGLR